jgi:hypothetical protein
MLEVSEDEKPSGSRSDAQPLVMLPTMFASVWFEHACCVQTPVNHELSGLMSDVLLPVVAKLSRPAALRHVPSDEVAMLSSVFVQVEEMFKDLDRRRQGPHVRGGCGRVELTERKQRRRGRRQRRG